MIEEESQKEHATVDVQITEEITEETPTTPSTDATTTPEETKARLKRLRAFLLKWHLPMFLVSGLVLGLAWPLPGALADDTDLVGFCVLKDACVFATIANYCVALIFLFSGLKLKTDEVKSALREWKAMAWGVLSILVFTPLVAFAVIHLEFDGITELGLGLALFFCMPTTLSSGPIITGQAKGNVAMALLLTTTTNLIGIFTAPLVFTLVVSTRGGAGSEATLDPVPLIIKLLFTILVPLVLGKSLRNFEKCRVFAKKHGVHLKILSSILLSMVPWMKVSATADDFGDLPAEGLIATIVIAIVVHILYLAFNYSVTTWVLHLPLKERKAVTIVTSQKTLPVAISILEFLPPEVVGTVGLATIPIIAAHLSQIIIDGFVAAKWASVVDPADEDEDKEVNAADGNRGQVNDDDDDVASLADVIRTSSTGTTNTDRETTQQHIDSI